MWDLSLSHDRCRGMFAAHNLGDALGGPFEFYWGKLDRYTGKLDTPLEFRSRWHPPKIGQIGETTDDTAMTRVLLDHLLKSNGRFNKTDLIVEYHRWASGATMVGRNTRELLRFKAKEVNTVDCYKRRWNKKFSNPDVAENQQSNGCLMRCLPFTLLQDWKEPARQDCYLTNPSELAWQVNELYLTGMKSLCQGTNRQQVFEELRDLSQNSEIQNIFTITSQNLLESKGWILNAFWCFLQALKWEGTLQGYYDWVIRAGGDTDTNACIGAAALGASMGFQGMMKESSVQSNWEILTTVDTASSQIESRPGYLGTEVQLPFLI